MSLRAAAFLALPALLLACPGPQAEPRENRSGDDDDDDDDSAAGDDDDDLADDDDSAGGDDDDSADDDDDDSALPGTPMVNRTYCLDWDSVDIIEPAGGSIIIGIVGLDDFPLLLSPTSASVQAEEISMLMATSQFQSCVQDLTQPTFDPTAGGPGWFAPPSFLLNAQQLQLPTGTSFIEGRNMQLSGDFTEAADKIENSQISGVLDVTDYDKYCGFPLTCFPCPWDDARQCITLYAVDGTWYDTLAGPLTPVR